MGTHWEQQKSNNIPPSPKRKKNCLWAVHVPLPRWLSRISILISIHHVFWPQIMAGHELWGHNIMNLPPPPTHPKWKKVTASWVHVCEAISLAAWNFTPKTVGHHFWPELAPLSMSMGYELSGTNWWMSTMDVSYCWEPLNGWAQMDDGLAACCANRCLNGTRENMWSGQSYEKVLGIHPCQ